MLPLLLPVFWEPLVVARVPLKVLEHAPNLAPIALLILKAVVGIVQAWDPHLILVLLKTHVLRAVVDQSPTPMDLVK